MEDKQMSRYTLTFRSGETMDQMFEGFLQFKNDTMAEMIVKAELVEAWMQDAEGNRVNQADPVVVAEEPAIVEEHAVEVMETPINKKFKRR